MNNNHQSTLHKSYYDKINTINLDHAIFEQRRIIAQNKDDPRSNLFKILRTKLLNKMRKDSLTSISITSATPGAGKTFIAVNLAIALAMEANQMVLLVDADLSRPKINWYFGFTPSFGLLDYLINNNTLEDVLVNPGFQRLALLPGRGTTSQSSELLSSPRMINLLKDIKSKYESLIILFDMPPLLASDDTLSFIPNFDAALLIIEDGKNTPDEIRRSIQLLEGSRLIGTVLNKTEMAQQVQY